MLAQMQNAGLVQDRRRDNREPDRRRSQGGNIVPPSPALVRHGSKQRRVPAALTPGGNTPGQFTPHSAAAQVNIPIGTPQRASAQHPYANPSTGGYDYGREVGDDVYAIQQQYGRASPMVSSVGAAPPAISNVRAQGGNTGISHGDGYNGQDVDDVHLKPSFLRILTCRC
jgi:casein kinase 1